MNEETERHLTDRDKIIRDHGQDEIIRDRRRKRIEKARRRKKRKKMLKRLAERFAAPAACVLLGIILLLAGIGLFAPKTQEKGTDGPDLAAEGQTGGDNLYKAEGQVGEDSLHAAEGQVGEDSLHAAEGQVGEDSLHAAEGQAGGGGTNTAEGQEAQEDQNMGEGRTSGNQNGLGGQDSQLKDEDPGKTYTAQFTSATGQPGEDVVSPHALLIDLETGEVLVQRDARSRINPASMTKILTVLVAAEHVENLDDTFTITLNETDYSYVNDCSTAGFAENETVTVRDLFYGTILPSGGEAAAGLAAYVAGTREAFVELMNEKLEELGLSDTAHFTNCVGLYDEEHYCTLYDMAMILEAALDNEICREVLSAHTYNTSSTEQHPEGLLLSNWFLRRIEDKDTGGEVMCAKTGYVAQSGNCAASYGILEDGRGYICVTAGATSAWRCIYDHVALYKEYTIPFKE